MSNSSKLSDENVLDDLRQQLADILRVDALGTRATEMPVKIAPQELGSILLSREQELGQRRASPRPDAAVSLMTPAATANALTAPQGNFLPMAPRSLEEAGLTESEVESLILKYLLQARTASGAEIARQVALPFTIVEKLLSQMKEYRLVVYKSISSLHDYVYELTEQGSALGPPLCGAMHLFRGCAGES